MVSRFADPAPGERPAALEAGIADRAEDGVIVFYAPLGAGVPASAPTGAPVMPSVQRVPEDAPAAAPAAAASPAPGAPGSDLDDLARKLYPKMRPYLKKELWLDRERAGLLTDSGR